MELKFDSNLDYQQHAVNNAVRLFEGQPKEEYSEYLEYEQDIDFDDARVECVANHLVLSEEQIKKNLAKIQADEGMAPSEWQGMNFTVEMETGTGKTYVYLRTIYELNRQYGFKKFVIVVPSIPIREGVIKTLDITYRHFQSLYDHVPAHYAVYDASKTMQQKSSMVKEFGVSDNIEILVINIDSFTSDTNIINNPNDRLLGLRPVQFMQATHPIVIVDEPQNMESDLRRQAINNLNPICTLRYSATPRNSYNLIYRLSPVNAYDMGLVKQIEVDSVMDDSDHNFAYVSLDKIIQGKTKITAKVTLDVNTDKGVKRKQVTVKSGDDLYRLSNYREQYASGYKVNGISVDEGCIEFSERKAVYLGEKKDGLHDEIMYYQMERTIEEHLNKELRLLGKGIKVLSLFFIDKVSNYRIYGSGEENGKLAKWFEDIYQKIVQKPKYALIREAYPQNASCFHDGYFSKDGKGHFKDTNGTTKADESTYDKIMRNKETLLDIHYPLRFIFSHTALHEGWDNPNVFQICTLNETKNELKKRQEIGRGLRLPVNQAGERIYDRTINRLTVVANEAYDDFAKQLQGEMRNDCGVDFSGRLKNKRDRVKIKYRKGFEVDPRFLEIWDKISKKTTYRINYDTTELIKQCALAVRKMPPTEMAKIRSMRKLLRMTSEGIEGDYLSDHAISTNMDVVIPDALCYIQRHTQLTRSTIYKIMCASERMDELAVNPQMFMDNAVSEIKRVLNRLMIDGIEYRLLDDERYEMSLFDGQQLEIYVNDFTFRVSNKDKTIYEEYVPLDSTIESQFAKDCETSEQVKFYFKLPDWFKIPTPIDSYNPDWAVVFDGDTRIYFVAETKDTGTDKVDINKLRPLEQDKIHCGKKCFEVLKGVSYVVVNRVSQLVE